MPSFGTRQDETGQRYTLHIVNTQGGRTPGQLVRHNIYSPQQPFVDIVLKLHDWRIWSRDKDAEPLTRCIDWNNANPGLRCHICRGRVDLPFRTTTSETQP